MDVANEDINLKLNQSIYFLLKVLENMSSLGETLIILPFTANLPPKKSATITDKVNARLEPNCSLPFPLPPGYLGFSWACFKVSVLEATTTILGHYHRGSIKTASGSLESKK